MKNGTSELGSRVWDCARCAFKLFNLLLAFYAHPVGYLGSLSWDPLGRIFSKRVFLNLLKPLGLPIPSNAMVASKKLKNFPRGCDFIRTAQPGNP